MDDLELLFSQNSALSFNNTCTKQSQQSMNASSRCRLQPFQQRIFVVFRGSTINRIWVPSTALLRAVKSFSNLQASSTICRVHTRAQRWLLRRRSWHHLNKKTPGSLLVRIHAMFREFRFLASKSVSRFILWDACVSRSKRTHVAAQRIPMLRRAETAPV